MRQKKESNSECFIVSLSYITFISADFTGCYKVHGYLLSNGSDTWKDMNTRSCMVLCHERNYRYAALQNDNQCACLNEPQYKKLEKLPTESCNARCMVNDEEICGDKTASSVFLAEARSTVSSDERTDALEGNLEFLSSQ